jgi:hypothetical protein
MHHHHSPLERPLKIYVLNNPRRKRLELRRPMLRAYGIAGVSGMLVLIAPILLFFYGPRNIAGCIWIACTVFAFVTFGFFFCGFYEGLRIIPHKKAQGPTNDERPFNPNFQPTIPHTASSYAAPFLGFLIVMFLVGLFLPLIVVAFGNSLVPVFEHSVSTRGRAVSSLLWSAGYTLVYWGWVFLVLMAVHFYFKH